ncbi:MAG: AAA family ATPase [bacterium]|nr:AAA family ATPase [bacterium]
MDINGEYKIVKKLEENRNTVIYRGIYNDQAVLLIDLRPDYPSRANIARFKHECELIRKADIDGVIKPIYLTDDKDVITLVLEDFDGISLKSVIETRKLNLKEFLNIAIQLADIISLVHRNNIIHKNIRPPNILYNEKHDIIKLTGFGISSILTSENINIYDPGIIQGVLVYMSPEQTGRMNRSVDYRTDLYSLGITLYELLTGQLPFESHDPMEIIYAHIANKPRPLVMIDKDIPGVLSNIILKLLSKNADKRYQNALGLREDLKRCLDQLNTNGYIEDFPLCEMDIPDSFIIPYKHVGRTKELNAIMDVFLRVSRGAHEVVFVSGEPGIGKTSLIREITRPIVEKRGYFISGKYDQFRNNEPYSAIISAFQGLIRQMLTEGDERLKIWKEKILRAMGNIGRVITDVIPEVELIVEKQPEIPELDSERAQNRFGKVFIDFIRVFASEEHPLVIFLDDLQWADFGSLSLFDYLINADDSEFLMLIGAYRDNEVDASHLLTPLLEGSRDRVTNITLFPLSLSYSNELISTILKCTEEESYSLAELLFQKTGGNPFFVNQYLVRIYEEKFLEFVPAVGWKWNMGKVKDMQVAENVIQLMVGKITNLPENTQEVLKIGACIGNTFDLEILTHVYEKLIETTLYDLSESIVAGLVIFADDQYSFVHDKVREAVYSLIPGGDLGAMHYRVGKLELSNCDETQILDKIFYIADQLNAGLDCILGPEKNEIARLNLVAGRKAKNATAYSSAVKYFGAGMILLDQRGWELDYELIYTLFLERAECEYLIGNFDYADSLFDRLLGKAARSVEKARVYDKKIVLNTNLGNHEKAVEYGLEALKMFGIDISQSPGRAALVVEFMRAKINLGRRTIPSLINSPEITDPEKLITMSLLVNAGTSAYFVNESLMLMLVMKHINMSLRYGNTSLSSFAYISYGFVLGYELGDFESGYLFGELALALNKKFNNSTLRSKLLFIFGSLINHWRKHSATTIDFLRNAITSGIESGDHNYAAFAAAGVLQHRIRKGDNLELVFTEFDKYIEFIRRTGNEEFINEFIIVERLVLCLQGETKEFGDYSDDIFIEEEFVRFIEGNRVNIYSYYAFKIQALYLAGKYEDAETIGLKVNSEIYSALFAQTNVTDFTLYYSLTLTALYAEASFARKKRFMKILRKNRRMMKKWADNSPDNYYHKYVLILAEIARIENDDTGAADLYDKAIKAALSNEYIQISALANELAASFYLEKGKEIIAKAYMIEAHYSYYKWGAFAKTRQLEELYLQILRVTRIGETRIIDHSSPVSGYGAGALDISTVLKSSQAISGEIVLEKLLKKLISVVMENAGATKGYLILEWNEKLVIEASSNIANNEVFVFKSIPVEGNGELSAGIVHYVARTKENLVLNDASNSGDFVKDSYIKKNLSKSILCVPIINQGKLAAIFYAENELTTDAFTRDRVELVQMLTSNAAIAIDNARLYANLEDKVRERTIKLEEAYDSIERAYKIIEEDLSLARRVQENILPKNINEIEGLNFSIFFLPMIHVGGDIYNVVEMRPGYTRIFLADATGHGVQAALVTMVISGEYEKLKMKFESPSDLVEALNDQFIENYKSLSVFFSCFIADIDLPNQRIHYVSAGHPEQFLISGEEINILRGTGKIIGFVKNLKYSGSVKDFKPGDKLLLFSDGIYEEYDTDGNEYGEERLYSIIKKNKKYPIDEIIKHIYRDVQEFVGIEREKMDDDVTLVGVQSGKVFS